MNITSEEGSLEYYAIISYSHADSDAVAELREFDKHNICYWNDKQMEVGRAGYDTQFRKMLDNKNCQGIIFFISDPFLLSKPCAAEMRYYKEKYGSENPDKFCLFILPKGYPYKIDDEVWERVNKYVEENKNDTKIQEGAKSLKEHIGLFLELNRNGKILGAKIGDNYIDEYCKSGGLFHKFEIIFGYRQVSNVKFGYFPQMQEIDKEDGKEEREFDKKKAYYAQIEWLVLKENEQTQTLLSKDLLFAVDYLSLKHPFIKIDKTLEEIIKENFMKYFKLENEKSKINNIRFLSEGELQALLRRNKENLEKKREILLPKATFFAQTSNVKNAPAFWLAGDINDARWVDAATESLSEQKAGTEIYYVRVVIEVEKMVN
ncbi:MAG: hypothetical protein FWC26_07650 [Fibromonadales bacterium]|nr:hypothetical protein [Fibromonadales bacterium]